MNARAQRPSMADIYEWPAVVNLFPEAASVYGLSRTAAYDLAQRGDFLVPVLRVGRLLRVSTASILQSLGAPLNPTHDEVPAHPLPGTGARVISATTFPKENDRA